MSNIALATNWNKIIWSSSTKINNLKQNRNVGKKNKVHEKAN